MREIERIFNEKETENGDRAYRSTGNKLLDLLFMSNYYEKHLKEVEIGRSYSEKLFSLFMRDPRLGLGRRDLGRELIKQAFREEIAESNEKIKKIVEAGRFDDLLYYGDVKSINYLIGEAKKGNELAKKWCPRLNSANRDRAKAICRLKGISEREYRKIIKCDTVENKLSRKRIEEIDYEKVPSLAMLKYYKRFSKEERFQKYLEDVRNNAKQLKVATTTVYDIYRNREKIDADLFFNKLEKIKINCIPILDTSGSMIDTADSYGKAVSIAHYLAKCSTYLKDRVISFSSSPRLMEIKGKNYEEEIESMYTGDCSNTNLAKVMQMLKGLKEDFPEYLVILSDMEFDEGSEYSKNELEMLWKVNGIKTKIVWWNFNPRNATVPEMDERGNIYISGYSPYLLKFLENNFDGEKFLIKLLEEYEKKIEL